MSLHICTCESKDIILIKDYSPFYIINQLTPPHIYLATSWVCPNLKVALGHKY